MHRASVALAAAMLCAVATAAVTPPQAAAAIPPHNSSDEAATKTETAEAQPADASKCIAKLHEFQEQERYRFKAQPSAKNALRLALQRAAEREASSLQVGSSIRTGEGTYPKDLEQRRWLRTREIIKRCDLGSDEDPVYLELLARQAASIEMVLTQEDIGPPDKAVDQLLANILLGTVPDPIWIAQSKFPPECNGALVLFSDGFISLSYQAAKAVVLSWEPNPPPNGSTYSFDYHPEAIKRVLAKDPGSEELLYKTLATYLFEGIPRAVGPTNLASNYAFALSILINQVERFVIAHEYGHGLFYKGLPVLSAMHLSSWRKEYLADTVAFYLEVESATTLDHIAPNVALQGGLFSFAVLDVLHQAIATVQCGHVFEDVGTNDHPPVAARIANLIELYRSEFSQPTGAVPAKTKPPEVAAKANLDVEGALVPSDTLYFLWNRIRPRFVAAHNEGRRLDGTVWEQRKCE